MEDVTDTEQQETAEWSYEAGAREAWVLVIQTALEHLGYESVEADPYRWVLEREATVAALRVLCEEVGDNDWPSDLHLADVIRKHLANHF